MHPNEILFSVNDYDRDVDITEEGSCAVRKAWRRDLQERTGMKTDEAKIRKDFEKSGLPSDAWGGWRSAYELTWAVIMREARGATTEKDDGDGH